MNPEITKVLSKSSGFEQGLKRRSTLEQYAKMLDEYIGLDMLDRANPKEIINKLKTLRNPSGNEAAISMKVRAYYAVMKWYRLKADGDMIIALSGLKLKYKYKKRDKYLTYEEVLRLLSWCKTDKERLIAELMVFTGLRLSAILGLKVGEIREDDRIFVPAARKGNKKGADYLTEYINPSTMKRLRESIKGKKPSDYVFDLSQMEKITEKQREIRLERKINAIALKAGILGFHCHVLRHSFGVAHFAAYKDVIRTRDVMGHTVSSSTDVYVKHDRDWDKKAKEFIEKGI